MARQAQGLPAHGEREQVAGASRPHGGEQARAGLPIPPGQGLGGAAHAQVRGQPQGRPGREGGEQGVGRRVQEPADIVADGQRIDREAAADAGQGSHAHGDPRRGPGRPGRGAAAGQKPQPGAQGPDREGRGEARGVAGLRQRPATAQVEGGAKPADEGGRQQPGEEGRSDRAGLGEGDAEGRGVRHQPPQAGADEGARRPQPCRLLPGGGHVGKFQRRASAQSRVPRQEQGREGGARGEGGRSLRGGSVHHRQAGGREGSGREHEQGQAGGAARLRAGGRQLEDRGGGDDPPGHREFGIEPAAQDDGQGDGRVAAHVRPLPGEQSEVVGGGGQADEDRGGRDPGRGPGRRARAAQLQRGGQEDEGAGPARDQPGQARKTAFSKHPAAQHPGGRGGQRQERSTQGFGQLPASAREALERPSAEQGQRRPLQDQVLERGRVEGVRVESERGQEEEAGERALQGRRPGLGARGLHGSTSRNDAATAERSGTSARETASAIARSATAATATP